MPKTSHIFIILNQIYLDLPLRRRTGRKFITVIIFRRVEGFSSLPQNHVRIRKTYGVQKTWKIVFGP